jgi:hypothetical protein
MRMAQLLCRAIRCIGSSDVLPASVAVAATAVVTETAPLRATMSGKSAAVEVAPAGISVSAIEVAAVEVAAIGKAGVEVATAGVSAIDVATTIGISAAIRISASVVFVLKTTPVKATAIEISGIPSFEKRPIVGIVSIIPIVAVPDRIVVVRISGEVSFKAYTIAVGISIIGIGVGALICGIRFLIYRSGSLVDDARLRIYLCIAPGGY